MGVRRSLFLPPPPPPSGKKNQCLIRSWSPLQKQRERLGNEDGARSPSSDMIMDVSSTAGGGVGKGGWGSWFPLSLAGLALLPPSPPPPPPLPPPPHLNPVLLVSRQFTGRLLDLFPFMAVGYTSCMLCMVQMKPTYQTSAFLCSPCNTASFLYLSFLRGVQLML